MELEREGVETRWRWCDRALHVELADGAHAVLTEAGDILDMDVVAGDVWRCLSSPVTLTQVVAELRTAYEVDEDHCRRDVLALLEQWREHGLVISA